MGLKARQAIRKAMRDRVNLGMARGKGNRAAKRFYELQWIQRRRTSERRAAEKHILETVSQPD
jgi:hypothetical protein